MNPNTINDKVSQSDLDESMLDLLAVTRSEFERKFDVAAESAAIAPGRVEVLGNHTDYNGGYTLSAAIDKRTCVVSAARGGSELIRMNVLDLNQYAESALDELKHDDQEPWANYVLGVLDQLQKLDFQPKLIPLALGIDGRVPLGAGVSSSAALEVATALAARQHVPFNLDSMELAKLCQRAENQFVGVPSGLMDQFSSVFGVANHLLFLDNRTLEHEAVSLGDNPAAFVVCNSMVKHALTGGEYKSRRDECESAAAKLGKKQLRDVTLELLESGKPKLTDNEYKRASHIVHEDERVLQAREALRSGDLATLGRLMNESHESSRTLFENTTPELDRLSDMARKLPGCYGARMTGGGFGGAVLALVDANAAEQFSSDIKEQYGQTIDKEPEVFVCRIADGAREIILD